MPVAAPDPDFYDAAVNGAEVSTVIKATSDSTGALSLELL